MHIYFKPIDIFCSNILLENFYNGSFFKKLSNVIKLFNQIQSNKFCSCVYVRYFRLNSLLFVKNLHSYRHNYIFSK